MHFGTHFGCCVPCDRSLMSPNRDVHITVFLLKSRVLVSGAISCHAFLSMAAEKKTK